MKLYANHLASYDHRRGQKSFATAPPPYNTPKCSCRLLYPATPFPPLSGPGPGSFNGLYAKNKSLPVAFLAAGLATCLLSPTSHAQATWEFETTATPLSMMADGSLVIGAETLAGSVNPDGFYLIPAANVELAVNASRDVMIGISSTPDEVPLRIVTKRPASLSVSDLAGQWQYRDFEIQTQIPGSSLHLLETQKLGVTLTSNGDLAIEGELAGNAQIGSSQNVILHVGDESLTFAINASKDLMVSLTEDQGEILLRLLVREDIGGSTADLQGNWNLTRFSIDQQVPDMGFALETASFVINSDGNTNIGGESITLNSSGDGTVTVTDSDGISSMIWSRSRNLLLEAEFQDAEYALPIVIRRASALTAAELAGTWDLHELTVSSPNLSESVAEAFYPDGTLAERYEFILGNDGQRLRNGLSRTFAAGSGLIVDTHWLADADAGTSVKNGTASHYDFDGETVRRVEQWVLDTLDGEPAVQEWDALGRETLNEFWDAGVITLKLETTYDALNPSAFGTQRLSTFSEGVKITEQWDVYHTGGMALASRTSLVFTDGVETQRVLVNFQIDGVTRTDDLERIFVPLSGITEESTRNYLEDGIGLSTSWFIRFIDSANPLLEISTNFHDDGLTVSLRTTTTAQESEVSILTEEFYSNGHPSYSGTTDGEGKQIGTVTTWYENGDIATRINYANGIQHGLEERYNESGQPTLIATYSFGQVVESTTTTYYPDGTRQFEQVITNGIQQVVETRQWYENGQLHYLTRLVDGLQDGLQTSFDELGNPTAETNYTAGVLNGPSFQWHAGTTQLATERNYTDGLLDGPSRDWFADGQLEVQQNYVFGLLHGSAEVYNQGGQPLRIENWVSDQLRSLETWSYYDDGVLFSNKVSSIRFGDLRDLPGESAVEKYYDTEGRLGYYLELAYGQPHGEERSYLEGVLISRSQYQDGMLEGIVEEFHSLGGSSDPRFGKLVSRTLYSRGQRNGISEEFDPATDSLIKEIHYQRDLRHGSYREFVGGVLTYQGEFLYGVPDGLHITNREDGTLHFRITYESGVQNGLYETYHENGQLASRGNYDRGLETGTWRFYVTDGSLLRRIDYLAGYRDGIYEEFEMQVHPTLRENYRAGLRDGLSESFFEGILTASTVYRGGVEVGPRRTYYPDGQLAANEPLVLERVEGVVNRYDPEGQLRERSNYRAGLLHGSSEIFYDDGSLAARRHFSAGLLNGSYQEWHSNGQLSKSGSYQALHSNELLSESGSYQVFYSNELLLQSSSGPDVNQCGIWRYYDTLGNLIDEQNFGTCSIAADPEFPIARGVRGVVLLNGEAFPGGSVEISSGNDFQSSFNIAGDGSFRYSLNQDNTLTSFTLKIAARPGVLEQEVDVTVPLQNGFVPLTIELEASANTAPSISFLTSVYSTGETYDFVSVPAIIDLPFSISDAETNSYDLATSFTLSNPALFQSAELLGVGAERFVRLTTMPYTAGNSSITVTVSDGELSSQVVRELRFAHAIVSRILRGSPSVLRDGQLLPLAAGDPIFEGDIVKTEMREFVRLQTPDGTVSNIGPSSEMLIERIELGEGGAIMSIRSQLIRGETRVEATDNPDRELILRTPSASIGIRGTIYEVTVDEIDGLSRTRIVVEEGAVEVTDLESGNSSLLGVGESISITASPPFHYSYEITGAKSGRFDFTTHSGYLYQLQRSTDLPFDPQALEVIDQVLGDGADASLSYDDSLSYDTRAFFRVVRMVQ